MLEVVLLLWGRALESLLGMSFSLVTFSLLSQGQPGSPGLKGESGDLGPQVRAPLLVPSPVACLSVSINPFPSLSSSGPQRASGSRRPSWQGWTEGEYAALGAGGGRGWEAED